MSLDECSVKSSECMAELRHVDATVGLWTHSPFMQVKTPTGSARYHEKTYYTDCHMCRLDAYGSGGPSRDETAHLLRYADSQDEFMAIFNVQAVPGDDGWITV